MNDKRVNALACALASLRGTAGGYSPEEITATITELQAMYEEQIAAVTSEGTATKQPG